MQPRCYDIQLSSDNMNTNATSIDNAAAAPTQLFPADECKQTFLDAFRKNQVLVVSDSFKSGKTTCLTRFMLEVVPVGLVQSIVCTQPRRLAVTSAAHYVARREGCHVGRKVGQHMRGSQKTSSATQLRFVTDGMALNYLKEDHLLREYTTLVVDEVHEQGQNAEMLLAQAKVILERRPEFKLVVMSATMSVDKYLGFFPGSEAFHVPGRPHEIEIVYLQQDPIHYLEAAVLQTCKILLEQPRGDIMIFLPTEADTYNGCKQVQDFLEYIRTVRPMTYAYRVVQLHGLQSPEDQSAAIEPFNGQKIIFATPVAETSITVPGLFYIVDAGWQRISLYDVGTDASQMPVVPATKANAAQRAGRVGRTQDGKCFRLYTHETLESGMIEEPHSQMATTQGSTALLMLLKAKQVTGVEVQLLTQVKDLARASAYTELSYLGLYSKSLRKLTPLGVRAAEYPLSAHLATMLLTCCAVATTPGQSEILTLVSMLSVDASSVFRRSSNKETLALQQRVQRTFICDRNEFYTLVRVFTAWASTPEADRSQWCCDHFIDETVLLKAATIRAQLRRMVDKDYRLKGRLTTLADSGSDEDAKLWDFNRLVARGTGSKWAVKAGNNRYLQAANPNSVVMILPKESTVKDSGRYVVYHECIYRAHAVMTCAMAVDEFFWTLAPQEWRAYSTKQVCEPTSESVVMKLHCSVHSKLLIAPYIILNHSR